MSYTDETPMPFGAHKGVAMANVPASYLLYIYTQDWLKNSTRSDYVNVREYIRDNIDVLKKEK